MQTTLAVTALVMGLVGGPHCVAMCGAACAGLGRAAGSHSTRALWFFQIGRITGYAMLGAVAAASIQGVGWLSIQVAFLRPVWTLFHVLALFLGILLLWKAQQPIWVEGLGRRIWSQARGIAGQSGSSSFKSMAPLTPLGIGMLWTFLPCGLLYSAVLVAAMTGQAVEGAAVMALFALGSSVSMMAGPWLWLRLRGSGDSGGSGHWGVRLAGTALAASSLWALYMGFAHDAAPWCVTLPT